jgi:hypothetical protein
MAKNLTQRQHEVGPWLILAALIDTSPPAAWQRYPPARAEAHEHVLNWLRCWELGLSGEAPDAPFDRVTILDSIGKVQGHTSERLKTWRRSVGDAGLVSRGRL